MSLLDAGREPGNAPAAFLGFRHRVRPVRRGGLVRDKPTPPRIRRDLDISSLIEAWCGLRGQLAMRCGDDTFVANPGDYVSLSKGVPHALSNVGDQEAVLLQTHYAAMNDVAGQTGQPVLGPPMSEEEARAIIARGR